MYLIWPDAPLLRGRPEGPGTSGSIEPLTEEAIKEASLQVLTEIKNCGLGGLLHPGLRPQGPVQRGRERAVVFRYDLRHPFAAQHVPVHAPPGLRRIARDLKPVYMAPTEQVRRFAQA